MKFNSTKTSFAKQLDAQDDLSPFRDQFVIQDPTLIYLDGNSLGRLPQATPDHMKYAIEHQWGERLIRGWNDGWIKKPAEVGAKIAEIIGARPDEVIVCDTTSINLYKLALAALQARPERKTILSDALNFPSDLYILQGISDLMGEEHRLDLIPSDQTLSVPLENCRERIGDDTALVTLSHVSFKSAFMYDMEKVTHLAHQAGALTLWDLSHSAGAVPLELHDWDVDLAVGCTYKYLNGGPGAPAFLYVRRDLQDKLIPPIWGWFGAQAPFNFDLDFTPARDLTRFQISTPHMLSLLAVEPALEIILKAGINNLRQKSTQQSEYLIYLAREFLFPLGYKLGSPTDASKRGSHVTLQHPEAYRICRVLIEPQDGDIRVIPDFREPDNVRLGIAPLYTTFLDLHQAVGRMEQIVKEKEYLQYSEEYLSVT
ncbi:MAG: kynureninase [Anaerolineales bacterium]